MSAVQRRAEAPTQEVPAEQVGSRVDLSYRDAFDVAAVGVYMTDAAGGITYYNEAVTEVWGRRPEMGEVWCGSWRLYNLDGRRLPHAECPMAIALREDRVVRGELAIAERPDGSRVVVEPFPTPMHDATGRLIGAINVVIDVTQRHRADLERQEAAVALAASNAVRDEFLGLVSHELRSPITTIYGNAEVLLQRGDDLPEERRRAMLDDIAIDSVRLRDIIENLLHLTRLASGEHPESEPILLGRTVERVVATFRARHGQRVLDATIPTDAIVVDIDETSFTLLLDNLLGNAHKYSEIDQPIEITLEMTSDEALIRVLDRGIGIAPEETEDVFRPFYRSHAARKRASGVGVGLAVCHRIVEAAGGRIWAHPRAGGGSEFGLALPLVTEER